MGVRRIKQRAVRVLLACCALAPALACGDSPVEDDDEVAVIAVGDTVAFDGLEATITRFNTSWIPFEGWLSSNVTLGIEVPFFSQGRIESSLVFGRVTDLGGEPRSEVALRITPVMTIPRISGGDSVVGQCRGAVASAHQVITDRAGWYRDTISTVSGDQYCIDVRVASEDGGGTRSSGIVRPSSIGNPLVEIPRARIDLMVEE